MDNETKSIVDPKYRAKYKAGERDWLSQTLHDQVDITKTVERNDGEAKVTKTVAAGIDVDRLFQLAKINHLDVAKFEAQRDGAEASFVGRMRMTISNMLRSAAKKRHGLFTIGDKGGSNWTEAPADWLAEMKAPPEPTHGKKGESLKVKAEKPAKVEEPKAEKPAKKAKAA